MGNCLIAYKLNSRDFIPSPSQSSDAQRRTGHFSGRCFTESQEQGVLSPDSATGSAESRLPTPSAPAQPLSSSPLPPARQRAAPLTASLRVPPATSQLRARPRRTTPSRGGVGRGRATPRRTALRCAWIRARLGRSRPSSQATARPLQPRPGNPPASPASSPGLAGTCALLGLARPCAICPGGRHGKLR